MHAYESAHGVGEVVAFCMDDAPDGVAYVCQVERVTFCRGKVLYDLAPIHNGSVAEAFPLCNVDSLYVHQIRKS